MGGRLFEYDGTIKQEKGQQFLNGRAAYNDGFTEIRRLQPHGFYSSPPKGSQGLLLYPNGNPDEAYLLGVEHHEHQPTGIPAGGTALYDANGNIIKIVGSQVDMDFQSNTATFKAGNWTIDVTAMAVTGSVTINGNLQVNGNITASGTITDSDGDGGA